MHILNIHRRRLPASAEQLASLIDGLSSPDDLLWSRSTWPPMKFDRALQVGAAGGHGPIRYWVEAYTPGRSIRFRFTAPKGFDGTHGFVLETTGDGESSLTHTVDMQVRGFVALKWRLVFGPLHDALIEDSLDLAAKYAGGVSTAPSWSWWVCFLRKILQRKPRRRSAL